MVQVGVIHRVKFHNNAHSGKYKTGSSVWMLWLIKCIKGDFDHRQVFLIERWFIPLSCSIDYLKTASISLATSYYGLAVLQWAEPRRSFSKKYEKDSAKNVTVSVVKFYTHLSNIQSRVTRQKHKVVKWAPKSSRKQVFRHANSYWSEFIGKYVKMLWKLHMFFRSMVVLFNGTICVH